MWREGVLRIGSLPKNVLEPSCGTGNLLNPIPKDFEGRIVAIEIIERYLNIARKRYKNVEFILGDFLSQEINDKFDLILMNPPFSERDPRSGCTLFIERAFELLSNRGRIVSVVSDYYLVNSEKRKRWLFDKIERIYWLPKMSFNRPLWIAVVVITKKIFCDPYCIFFDDNESQRMLFEER